jgi:hypothetical protein
MKKHLLQIITLGALVLLTANCIIIEASEEDLVTSNVHTLADKFKKIGATEEAKTIASLNIPFVSGFKQWITARSKELGRRGLEDRRIQMKLSQKTSDDLLKDYLQERSLGESEYTQQSYEDYVSQMEPATRNKLVETLSKRNKDAIKQYANRVKTNSELVRIYGKTAKNLSEL